MNDIERQIAELELRKRIDIANRIYHRRNGGYFIEWTNIMGLASKNNIERPQDKLTKGRINNPCGFNLNKEGTWI